MNPVELAKSLESIAKQMLDESLNNDGSLVVGLYETKERARLAFFDLETAVALNSLRRQATGQRASPPAVHARAVQRAKELLAAKGG
jgi:hypothetical protein